MIHRNIRLLTWFNFLLDFRFYAPVAIIYFAQVSGSYALGMSVFSVTMLSAALLAIPTGIFSDLIGRKKTLVLGAMSTLVSVTFYAIGGSYAILLIGAVLEGLARALYSGNNEAFLHDTLAETGEAKEYAEYLGKTSSVEQVALAITAISGAVIAYWSFGLVMWLSVIPAGIGLLVSLAMIEPKLKISRDGNIYQHIGEAIVNFRRSHKLQQLTLASVLGYARGESGYLFRSAFIATLWPVWAIGISKFISNVGAALSFYYGGKLIKRYGAFRMLITGKYFALVTNVVSTIMPTLASPLLLASNSTFYGVGSVASSALMQKEYTDKQRSTMGSIGSLFGSIGFGLVSFGLGLVADVLTPGKALLLLEILAIPPIIIYIKLYKKYRD